MAKIEALADHEPFDENGLPIIRSKDVKALLDRIDWLTRKIAVVDDPSFLEAERTALFRVSKAVAHLKHENRELKERIKVLEHA